MGQTCSGPSDKIDIGDCTVTFNIQMKEGREVISVACSINNVILCVIDMPRNAGADEKNEVSRIVTDFILVHD